MFGIWIAAAAVVVPSAMAVATSSEQRGLRGKVHRESQRFTSLMARRQNSSAHCPETSYNVTFDGHLGNFILREEVAGTKIQRNCTFGNKAYVEGTVTFTCEKGAWNFTDYTCSDCPSNGCGATNYSVELSGRSADFFLKCDRDGAKAQNKCSAFSHSGDNVFGVGVVDFECLDGGWSFAGHTCGEASGSCMETNFTVELEGDKAYFLLPSGGKGSTQERPCEFSGKTYEEGEVEFECVKGKWELKDNSCADCPRAGCPTTEYTVIMGESRGVFGLRCATNGTTQSHPCEFENKVYETGSVEFVCVGEEWEYIGQTCSEKFESHPQVKPPSKPRPPSKPAATDKKPAVQKKTHKPKQVTASDFFVDPKKSKKASGPRKHGSDNATKASENAHESKKVNPHESKKFF